MFVSKFFSGGSLSAHSQYCQAIIGGVTPPCRRHKIRPPSMIGGRVVGIFIASNVYAEAQRAAGEGTRQRAPGGIVMLVSIDRGLESDGSVRNLAGIGSDRRRPSRIIVGIKRVRRLDIQEDQRIGIGP